MTENHVEIGDVVADALVQSIPTVRVGDPATLQLSFQENSMPNVFDTPQERHRRLYDYVEWANDSTITVGRSSSGVSHYRESVPARAPIESFVNPIGFGDDINRVPDYWAAITGGSNETSPGGGLLRLDVETTVLARREEYDTRSEIVADLGASVV
jgi:hypothetical protein